MMLLTNQGETGGWKNLFVFFQAAKAPVFKIQNEPLLRGRTGQQ